MVVDKLYADRQLPPLPIFNAELVNRPKRCSFFFLPHERIEKVISLYLKPEVGHITR